MERKKLLLVNDDGYFSEGILILYEVLKKRFLVKVVAPDRNLSGAGHSLTFTKPLRIRQVDRDIYTVIEEPPLIAFT